MSEDRTSSSMSVSSHARDIETMRVRGAGAIARHAAEALADWARTADPGAGFEEELEHHVARLAATRPSAVSLHNALAFIQRAAAGSPGDPDAVMEAAETFMERSLSALTELGERGAHLVPREGRVLTHCNSQAVLSVLEAAWEGGARVHVIATETRPWRQGLITVTQLSEAGIPSSLIVDNAANLLLTTVDAVLVGCDSIAANGDIVNKVGTSTIAMACQQHGVPFYVCAETYKVNLDAPTGADVDIEERDTTEVVEPGEVPEDVEVLNPVFDITPHEHVTAILTEQGPLDPGDVEDAARRAWGA